MAESPQAGGGIAGRFASKPTDVLVRLSGRSWWEVMFFGGDTLAEWQTAGAPRWLELPLPRLSARSRWEDVDKSKVVAARLWCPNGQTAEVRATGPYRIFQFKVGGRNVVGGWTDAHVLGVLTDDEGGCACWEYQYAPGRLARFDDNVLKLHDRYRVGPFSHEAIGIRI